MVAVSSRRNVCPPGAVSSRRLLLFFLVVIQVVQVIGQVLTLAKEQTLVDRFGGCRVSASPGTTITILGLLLFVFVHLILGSLGWSIVVAVHRAAILQLIGTCS